nr:hypothetical protein HmN_000178400 [Hymenolepis microstoma]
MQIGNSIDENQPKHFLIVGRNEMKILVFVCFQCVFYFGADVRNFIKSKSTANAVPFVIMLVDSQSVRARTEEPLRHETRESSSGPSSKLLGFLRRPELKKKQLERIEMNE